MILRTAIWTTHRNLLVLRCRCGAWFTSPADRARVRCRACGREAGVERLRVEYMERRRKER